MKFGIIVSIVFVLLTPLSIFAQEIESEQTFDDMLFQSKNFTELVSADYLIEQRLDSLSNKIQNNQIFIPIISVLASGILAFVIVIYKQKKIDPQKLKRVSKLRIIEKRLQAYGTLLSFLEESLRRGINWNKDKPLHSMQKPEGTTQFRKIFADYNYLFSQKLNDEFYNKIESDTRYGLVSKASTESHISSSQFSMDLHEMHEITKNDFKELKCIFNELTDYEYE